MAVQVRNSVEADSDSFPAEGVRNSVHFAAPVRRLLALRN